MGAILPKFLRITLLQRYLFKELVSVFALSLVALLFLVLMGRGLQLRELFVGLDLGIGEMLYLFGCLTPFFLMLVLPIACLLSVFLTFLRMNSDRELIALKTGGIGINRMLAAPMAFCIICFILTLLVSLHGINFGMSRFRDTIMTIANTRARLVIQPGVFNQDIPGLTIFAKNVDLVNGELSQVVVDDRTRNNISMNIVAPTGRIMTDQQQGELVFELKNGQLYRVSGEQVNIAGFNEYLVRISLNEIFKGVNLGEVRPREMSWRQLLKNVRSYAQQPQTSENVLEYNKFMVEIHKRWVFPAACLVLGFLAIPMACSIEGLHRQFAAAFALILFFIYYSMQSMAMSIGESGVLPPAAAMWLPNAIFMIFAFWGYRLASRERFHFVSRAPRWWRRLRRRKK